MGIEATELRHLKRVSRIKHQILTRYLPSWAVILGSTFDLLYYVDCFAGPGRYETDGEQVDGSPIIAVKAGKEFATKNAGKKLGVVLVDDDHTQLKQLQEYLGSTLPYPTNFEVRTRLVDSHALIPKIIEQIRRRRTAPSFFLVDPYGHPLSIPVRVFAGRGICGTGICGTESAGINRHIVGDERALRKRRSDSILASSLACDSARKHSEA